MKRMKRVLSLLLVLCMVATLAPVSGLAAENRPLVTPESDFQAQVDQVEQGTETMESPMSGLAGALEENQPEQAQPVTVTAEEVENPGVDLKKDSEAEALPEDLYQPQEQVRIIVVLEEASLLEQGFTTAPGGGASEHQPDCGRFLPGRRGNASPGEISLSGGCKRYGAGGSLWGSGGNP